VAGLLLATVVPAGAAQARVSTATCPDVEVISVRGMGEPAGTPGWVIGPIVDAMQQGLTQGVSSYPLPYAATADLIANTNQGITLLVQHLNQKIKACPKTRYVVIGFSLGALVVGEGFARPATRYPGVVTTAIPTSVDTRLVAAIVLGDGRFNANSPEAAGTFWPGVSAPYARATGSFSRWGNRVRDVCNAQDGICQAIPGTQSTEIAHQDYVKYKDALTQYVAGTLFSMP
jgi:pimeloyl-ACP methyl ester carboxylesterase